MSRRKSEPSRPRDLKIDYRSPTELKAYPRNARRRSPRQQRYLEDSIRKFGFNCPVIIADDGEIVAGHARVKAAEKLGLLRIPTITLPPMAATDRRAFILADNRVAELATWDRDMLAIELQDLIDLGVPDITLTGFTLADIDDRLEEATDKKRDLMEPEDDVPGVKGEVVTRAGDLWLLGSHRLLCGNATLASDYGRLMDSKLASMVFADAPYNRPVKSFSGRGRIRHPDFVQGFGEMSEHEFIDFLASFLQHSKEVTLPGSIIFACMDWAHIYELLTAGRQQALTLKNLIVWMKSTPGMGSFYRSQHELLAVFKHGDAPHTNTFELGQHGRNRSNVWRFPGGGSFRANRLDELKMHPCVKPVQLIADAIRDVTARGEIVLDPFAGSGSTLIAAEKTGRIGYAMELDSRYCDVIVRRWQAYTGKLAQLEPTGAFFEDVEAERKTDDAKRMDVTNGTRRRSR